MAQDNSTLVRPKILTNSAAEFVETRAQEALGSEVVGPGSPQYVPVRDQFVPRGEIASVDYHAESAAKLKQLETTLRKFAMTIKDRGFDKTLNIALKDPKLYSMADVLTIAGKIQERHRNADKVKTAMGMIRKCFRTAEDNHGQLKRLLKFVPNDTYGTVISGGFTIILGAVERAENIRTDIYEALADIPLKLKEVQDLADVHYQSADLQRRADSVFIAIFIVLERIVDELTKNMAKKGMSLIFKGDRHSFDLTEALNDLEKRLKDFRTQATVCLQQKFGRMDYKVTRSMLAAENSEMMNAETSMGVADIQKRFDRFEKRWEESKKAQTHRQARLEHIGQALLDARSTPNIEEARHETLQTNVYNSLYVFLTGNPSFDPRTGLIDQIQAIQMQNQIAFPVNPKDPTSSWANRNKKVVKNWLDHLRPVHYAVNEDIQECLQSLGTFSLAERDKIQWIMTSDEIHHWLRTSQSSILVVEPQTYPDGILNPIAFTSAFLTKILKKQEYPTIGFFASLRANVSMDESISGPNAMLASILAQLLIQIRKKRPGIDIAAAASTSVDTASLQDAGAQMERINRLFDQLSERDCVFLVLDSVVDLTGSDAKNDSAIRSILNLADSSRLVVKILMTSAFSAAALEGIDHGILFLPDVADAGSHDINPVFFEGDTMDSIEYFEAQEQDKRKQYESSSEEEDDASTDSQWD